jgi:hypothetical protein
MLRTTLLAFVLALAAVVQPYAALAQEKACMEVMCRARGTFRTCDRPLDGAKILSARVLAMSRECSNNILSVQVENERANSLPAVVEIDLGPCVSFSGKSATQLKLPCVSNIVPMCGGTISLAEFGKNSDVRLWHFSDTAIVPHDVRSLGRSGRRL